MSLASISIKRPVFAWMLMIALIVFGILVNDGVCVYFSGIVDRYGARVIWLLPLLALALLERSHGAGTPAASPA